MSAPAGDPASSRSMIVTTTENIPDTRVVKTLGQVFGLTVRSRSLGGNIAAGLKSLAGGEIRSYVKLNEDSRRQAIDRMVQNAAAMGANAVTMMRFDSTEMGRSHERDRGLRHRPGDRVDPAAVRQHAGLSEAAMHVRGMGHPGGRRRRASSSPCSAGTGTGAAGRPPPATAPSRRPRCSSTRRPASDTRVVQPGDRRAGVPGGVGRAPAHRCTPL